MIGDPDGDTTVDAQGLVTEVLRDAGLPAGSRAQMLVQQELLDHLEDATNALGSKANAAAAFGDPRAVAEALRAVYRLDVAMWLTARMSACVIVAAMAGVLVLAGIRLSIGPSSMQSDGEFLRRAGNVLKLVIGGLLVYRLERRAMTLDRIAAASAVYALLAAIIQWLSPDGFANWYFWNVPIMIVIGSLAWRVRSRPLAVVLTYAGFLANMLVFVLTHGGMSALLGGQLERMSLMAIECTVSWTVVKLLLLRSEAPIEHRGTLRAGAIKHPSSGDR